MRWLRGGVLGVALLVFVGCAEDPPSELAAPRGAGLAVPATSSTVAPTGDTSPTDTTAGPAVANVVPSINGQAPAVTPAGNQGSGCGQPGEAQVGADHLPDGLWGAAVIERGPTLAFDLVCVSQDGAVVNDVQTRRTNDAAPDLIAIVRTADGPMEMEAGGWLSLPADGVVYWVAVNGGVVTSVEQLA